MSKQETQKQLDNLENIKLAIYVNNEKSETIPTKGENIFDEIKSSCTNDAYIIWDYESWSPIVKNVTTSLTKCNLYFKKGYSEAILNGTDPIIKDELIPVTIDSDGTVKKADIGSEWYNYEKKNWANAIILKDEIEDYLAGEVIPEDKIESYFVWIPKYRYQLWDLGQYNSLTAIDESKVHEIPIIFGNYNTSDDKENECTTPMESGATGNCQVGDYMTHPAFLSIPSTGFWVGKFSVSYINDSIEIKPNRKIYLNFTLGEAFKKSYDYKRNLDSHLTKNTEWGAINYLIFSKYGANNILSYNTNQDKLSGYSSNAKIDGNYSLDSSPYNTEIGYLASTTGNITGIYDMSGGTTQYVMGINNIRTFPDSNISIYELLDKIYNIEHVYSNFYNNTQYTKYYDLYYGDNSYSFNKRILGDATGEFGPFENSDVTNRQASSWFISYSYFIYYLDPYFIRCGTGLGENSEHSISIRTSIMGGGGFNQAFHIILTPILS